MTRPVGLIGQHGDGERDEAELHIVMIDRAGHETARRQNEQRRQAKREMHAFGAGNSASGKAHEVHQRQHEHERARP